MLEDIAILLLYIVMWVVSYTSLNARDQWFNETIVRNIFTKEMGKEDMIVNAIIASIPIAGWLAAVMITVGYKSGFIWRIDPAMKRFS